MRCTFLANCGVLLESGGESVLIDAPNGLHTAFDGVSDEEFQKMCSGVAPYDGLCGMLFTHTHADHFDRKRVLEVCGNREGVSAFIPDGSTSAEGILHMGKFRVRFFTVDHSGEEFWNVKHRVFLVDDGERSIYFTGDADWLTCTHNKILSAFQPHAAVWNPNFVSHEEGRSLLEECRGNYICHLPVYANDTYGFGRKCMSCYVKFQDKLKTTKLIDRYPLTVEI